MHVHVCGVYVCVCMYVYSRCAKVFVCMHVSVCTCV